MCICIETFCAPFRAAALEVCNLLDTDIELGLPRILWDVDVFAVENLVYGIRAVVEVVLAPSPSSDAMMSPGAGPRCGGTTKKS